MGAANLPTDGGYADKVMAEYARLYQVARGHALPPAQRAAPAGAADLRASTGGTQAPTVVAKLAS